MKSKHRSLRWPRLVAVGLGAVVALTFATMSATASSAASSSGGIPLANPFGYKYGYKAAVAELPKLYAGTSTKVNTTPRPAAKNKYVVIISAGQASISSYVPVDAAAAAAKAIGWKVTILDGKLDPSTYGGLVSQAIAMGAQGIVLDGIDCDEVRGPLAPGQGPPHRRRAALRL